MGIIAIIAEASTNPLFLGATGISLTGLILALMREYGKSSSGAYKIIRQKNADLHYKDWVISKRDARIAQLEVERRIKEGFLLPGTLPDVADPGPYVPPTPEELEKL